MTENPFPDPPKGKDLLLKDRIPPVFWWVGAFVLVGATIIFWPWTCSTDGLNLPEREVDSAEDMPGADQDKDLEYREDGMWYRVDSTEPFSGAAVSYHEDGKMKSRTKIKNGEAYGLIEEWDENGSVRGNLFKEEFNK
jgi:hypothetical protein